MTKKRDPTDWKFDILHESELVGFRPIPDTDGDYLINDVGIVVSRRRSPPGYWIKMKTAKSRPSQGFNQVAIQYGAKRRHRTVGALILEAFVGFAPSPEHLAAHRNGISDDDRLDNLLWAIPVDISKGRISRGTWVHGDRCHTARFEQSQIRAIRKIVEQYHVPTNLLAEAIGEVQSRVRELVLKTWQEDKWKDLENPLLLSNKDQMQGQQEQNESGVS